MSGQVRTMARDLMEWRPPPRDPALSSQDVHLWRVSLDRSDKDEKPLLDILSIDERARADRFCFAGDCKRFILCRRALRAILSCYTGIRPEYVNLGQNEYGKPHIAPEFNPSNLQFNLAHSNDLALIAIARDHMIGVDLEYVRPLGCIDRIAVSHFSQNEIYLLDQQTGSQKLLTFLRIWTCKEAEIKARGLGWAGSSEPPKDSPGTKHPIIDSSDMGELRSLLRWTKQSFTIGRRYIGALVVEGHPLQISCWHWR